MQGSDKNLAACALKKIISCWKASDSPHVDNSITANYGGYSTFEVTNKGVKATNCCWKTISTHSESDHSLMKLTSWRELCCSIEFLFLKSQMLKHRPGLSQNITVTMLCLPKTREEQTGVSYWNTHMKRNKYWHTKFSSFHLKQKHKPSQKSQVLKKCFTNSQGITKC